MTDTNKRNEAIAFFGTFIDALIEGKSREGVGSFYGKQFDISLIAHDSSEEM